MNKVERDIANLPDTTVSVREVFGIDSDMMVPAYAAGDSYVPELDPDYLSIARRRSRSSQALPITAA